MRKITIAHKSYLKVFLSILLLSGLALVAAPLERASGMGEDFNFPGHSTGTGPKNLGKVKAVSTSNYAIFDTSSFVWPWDYEMHTCAITTANILRCWGGNFFGETNVPANLGAVKSVVAANTQTCAITLASRLRCWGEISPMIPKNLGAVKAVTVGDDHVCFITSADLVRCWGEDDYDYKDGEPAAVPSDLGAVKSISASGWHTCAVDNSDLVRCWGKITTPTSGYESYPVSVPGNLGPVKQVSAGPFYDCAVTTSNVARCWNTKGFVAVPASLGAVKEISPALDYSCAITAADLVRCWNTVKEINTPTTLGAVSALSSGTYYSCVVTSSGDMRCWGDDSLGQLTGLPPKVETFFLDLTLNKNTLTAVFTDNEPVMYQEPAWITRSWSWQRSANGAKGPWATIPGANKSTYTVGSADRGKYVRACRAYTNSEGSRTGCSQQRGPFR